MTLAYSRTKSFRWDEGICEKSSSSIAWRNFGWMYVRRAISPSDIPFASRAARSRLPVVIDGIDLVRGMSSTQWTFYTEDILYGRSDAIIRFWINSTGREMD